MNIIVRQYGSDLCYCRPDTTWERENRDFYSPECVNEIYCAPVLFARISKAGKCIGEKFAGRYYDGIGFGILMYCSMDGSRIDVATGSCIDHTSILPMPLYNPVVLDNAENCFELNVSRNDGSEDIYRKACSADDRRILEDTLCKASSLTSLRIGDFIAVELGTPQKLISRAETGGEVKSTFCENELFDFKIIF